MVPCVGACIHGHRFDEMRVPDAPGDGRFADSDPLVRGNAVGVMASVGFRLSSRYGAIMVIPSQADSFLDVGRRFNIGYEEREPANPGVDAWIPGEGRRDSRPSEAT